MENLESLDVASLLEKGQELVALYGLKVVAAIVIFLIGKWLAKLVSNGVRKGMEARSVDPTLVGFTAAMVHYALIAFVIIATLGQLGIQTASFIAVLGAAGLAVGLALQGSLSNFAAGVLMVIFRPFRVGDYIEAGGTAGIVERIHIFQTELRSPDNKAIIVPNSGIMGGNIINYSRKEKRRVDLLVGVSYDAYLPDVKKVLEEVVAEDERVLKDEDTVIAVHAMADSAINLVVRPWVKTADFWPVYWDLTEKIKLRLDEKGIGIPYPQMDVHFFKDAS